MARAPFPPTDYDYRTGKSTPMTLTYSVSTEPFYIGGDPRREHVHVFIRWALPEDVATILAGTVDNKDGYGSASAAQDVGRCAAGLLRQGVTTTYNLYNWSRDSAGLHLQWQQYDDTRYCTEPRVMACGEDRIEHWETRVKLYRWLEKLAKGDLRDPRALLDAMHKRGGVALLPWPERKRRYGEHHGSGGWIAQPHTEALACLPIPARASEAA